MKLFFSIILNASILYAITYLLWPNSDKALEAWVALWCQNCEYFSIQALKTYILGGVILWIINSTLRPILRILSLPLYFIFLWLVSFFINAIILYVFGYIINDILMIPGVWYEIIWNTNFIIAVAIFTVLNTVYSLLHFKK